MSGCGVKCLTRTRLSLCGVELRKPNLEEFDLPIPAQVGSFLASRRKGCICRCTARQHQIARQSSPSSSSTTAARPSWSDHEPLPLLLPSDMLHLWGVSDCDRRGVDVATNGL